MLRAFFYQLSEIVCHWFSKRQAFMALPFLLSSSALLPRRMRLELKACFKNTRGSAARDFGRKRGGDHNAQWLRLEREKLDLDLRQYNEEAAARQHEADALKNPKKGGPSPETLALIEETLHLL
jgi:hypothetical protein